MTKKLNEAALQNELAGSAFFTPSQPETEPAKAPAKTPAVQDTGLDTKLRAKPDTVTPRHREPVTPPLLDNEQVIETIRRAVHQFGKEDATYRFTEAEKKALADVVYMYGASGIKTSQNEIARIAINWLMDDYRENGRNSVLARVLERLNE